MLSHIQFHNNDDVVIKQYLNLFFPPVLTTLITSYYLPWSWSYFDKYNQPDKYIDVLNDNIITIGWDSSCMYIINIETKKMFDKSVYDDRSCYYILGCFDSYIYYTGRDDCIYRLNYFTKELCVLYCYDNFHKLLPSIRYIKNNIIYTSNLIGATKIVIESNNLSNKLFLKNICCEELSILCKSYIGDIMRIVSVLVNSLSQIVVHVKNVFWENYIIELNSDLTQLLCCIKPDKLRFPIQLLYYDVDKIVYENSHEHKLYMCDIKKDKKSVICESSEYVQLDCECIKVDENLIITQDHEFMYVYRT